LDYLQSRYSERLNQVVIGLTGLSALSVIVALIDYTFGGPLTSPQTPRVALLAGGTVLLGAGLRLIWVRSSRSS
jgi:hypothetical protein